MIALLAAASVSALVIGWRTWWTSRARARAAHPSRRPSASCVRRLDMPYDWAKGTDTPD